jgi:hypothetical protein
MTAITFPIKKFPGQIKHNHIGFTGRIFIHPILVALIILLHTSLVIYYEFSINQALISYIPILFLAIVFSIYLIDALKRNYDYFDLSYEQLEKTFDQDKSYFKKMFIIGLIFSIITWLIGLQYPSNPDISRMIVNSIFMSTYLIRTTLYGIYTQSKAIRIIGILLVIEILYWNILRYFPLFDLLIILVLFLLNYKTLVNYDKYKAIKLLKNIIS